MLWILWATQSGQRLDSDPSLLGCMSRSHLTSCTRPPSFQPEGRIAGSISALISEVARHRAWVAAEAPFSNSIPQVDAAARQAGVAAAGAAARLILAEDGCSCCGRFVFSGCPPPPQPPPRTGLSYYRPGPPVPRSWPVRFWPPGPLAMAELARIWTGRRSETERASSDCSLPSQFEFKLWT